MLQLLIDENLDHRILRGLKLRVPGLQYVVVQDTELRGSRDAALLEWAAAMQYVLVTHDVNTLPKAARERIQAGRMTAGLIIVPEDLAIATAIEDLTVAVECSNSEEFRNHVLYLPL